MGIQVGWANPYESMDNVQSLKDGYYPGDLKFDPLGLKPDDPEELRIMQEKELSHGRGASRIASSRTSPSADTSPRRPLSLPVTPPFKVTFKVTLELKRALADVPCPSSPCFCPSSR